MGFLRSSFLTITFLFIYLKSSLSKFSDLNQINFNQNIHKNCIESKANPELFIYNQTKNSMFLSGKSLNFETIISPIYNFFSIFKGTSSSNDEKDKKQSSLLSSLQEFFVSEDEFCGLPKVLIPYYLSFIFDSIAVGFVMPILPFVALNLGANAFQLSLVISSNYFVQSIGCILMGKLSDTYGRKIAMMICLTASVISYLALSQADSLMGIALAKMIAGSFGGLVPIMQSTVADVAPLSERPKYMGRITAAFGLGFVLGPGINALMPNFSIKSKILFSSLLPLIGLIIIIIFSKDSKDFIPNPNKMVSSQKNDQSFKELQNNKVNSNILWLILNGFSLMYAFGTESIYAILLKEGFGYGENTLSTLLAGNGVLIGLFQVFLIKPLVNVIGKHATLLLGNMGLAFGMLGIALVRTIPGHFVLFCIHMVCYSIADTSLVSLISRYSSVSSQGQNLAFNQASQSLARVVSPLIAGYLYDLNKSHPFLPLGSYPFLLGALFPAISAFIPIILYYQNHLNRSKKEEDYPQSTKTKSLNTLLNNSLIFENQSKV